jgi:hypothetical protein
MVHRIILVLAFTLLIAACGTQEVEEDFSEEDIEVQTPQEAIDLGIEVANDECELLPGDECKDYKLTCSEKIELSEADKAKNIEEKWCFAIGYQKRSPTLSPDWKADEGNYSLEKREGKWEEKGFCICRIAEGSEDSSGS